jgi:hypothetical protein
MNNLEFKRNIHVLPVFIFLAASLQGQGITLESDNRQVTSGEEHSADLFMDLMTRVKSGHFEAEAAGVLTSAETCTLSEFDLPNLQLELKTTLRDGGGDNLIAAWKFQDRDRAGTVILNDTPYFSQYVLRVSNPKITSASDAQEFLNSLFDKASLPVEVRATKFTVSTSGARVRVDAHFMMSPQPLVHEFRLSGTGYPDAWYGTVLFGKGLLQKCYAEPTFIPERFPALTELVKSWSVSRLWSEFGDKFDSPLARQHADDRNRVIITELLRRGMSPDDVIRLLQLDPNHRAERWVLLVTSSLVQERPGWVDEYLRPILTMYESVGPSAAAAVVNLFGAAALQCSHVAESVASDALNDPTARLGASAYLTRCSSSVETLGMLRQMVNSGQLPESERHALSLMETRIRGAAVTQ